MCILTHPLENGLYNLPDSHYLYIRPVQTDILNLAESMSHS